MRGSFATEIFNASEFIVSLFIFLFDVLFMFRIIDQLKLCLIEYRLLTENLCSPRLHYISTSERQLFL